MEVEEEKERRRKKRKRQKDKKSHQLPRRAIQKNKMEYTSRVIQLRGSRPQGQLVVTDGGWWWMVVVDGRKKCCQI